MNKRTEARWRRQCQRLYQNEAKEMYASWIQQANDLASQDEPDEDKYWELKEIEFKAGMSWEDYIPCGYWPKEMRDDSYKLSCVYQKIWKKIIANKNKSAKQ